MSNCSKAMLMSNNLKRILRCKFQKIILKEKKDFYNAGDDAKMQWRDFQIAL